MRRRVRQMLVNQEPHEFRDGERRMRVVEMDRGLVRQCLRHRHEWRDAGAADPATKAEVKKNS